MADSSWDNAGHGVPAKTGLPLWGKIALGCGISFLVVLVTCVGGVAYVTHKAKTNPDWFKKKVEGGMGMMAHKFRPDWEDFRLVVEQLRTPEGCRALYAASPELANTWPTETAFLETASGWHKEVVPAPEWSAEIVEQGLHIKYAASGRVAVGWSPKSGRSVYVVFERARKAGDTGPRRLVEVDVR